MSRRIFAEHGFRVAGHVLPYDEFRLFADQEGGLRIDPGHTERLLQRAEAVLQKEYPVLTATDYMMYRRNGNRNIYEGKFFQRRDGLLTLAVAEYVERKGRFVDKLIDLLWMILEESTWVLPAHNNAHYLGAPCPLPPDCTGEVQLIDLFAATTAADVAWAWYLCHDELDAVTPMISERIHYELQRRIMRPFLDPVLRGRYMWWTGVKGNVVNNWCPWIVSNVLTVAALTVQDRETREAVVRDSLSMLDNFTSVYHEDGGCDEGPSYWNVAGGALFNALLVLYDMTGGYVNVFDDPLIRNMGEYAVKAVIFPGRGLNFADAPARVQPNAVLLYQWGCLSHSEFMRTYGLNRLNGALPPSSIDAGVPYRSFRFLTQPAQPAVPFLAPEKFWLDGIVVAGTRESREEGKGLYMAIKGGSNNESHNHNDIGNLIVFSGEKPIFLDAGSGTYTRRTFSPERYTIWAMCSDYHNVATINGVTQRAGGQYYSTNHVYDEESGGLTMSLQHAYPDEAGIESYTRSAVLANGRITLTDTIALKDEGTVTFSFMLAHDPTEITDSSFRVEDRTVHFDPRLSLRVEVMDHSWPEVERIPKAWDTDALRRVTLTAKAPFRSTEFVLTVE